MTNKTLNYRIDNSSFLGVVSADKDNLAKLSKDLNKSDAQDIYVKVAELIKYIGDIYNQEKYKSDPRNIKFLKAGKLELEVENHQSELSKSEKEALKRFGDYNKIDVRDLDLSIRAVNCIKAYNLYTLRDVIEKGEKRLSTLRNFGEKSRKELRNLIYRFAPEEYDKYIGEIKNGNK